MELEKWKLEADYFTGKLSDFNKQLAFSGIAVIWIFKNSSPGDLFPNKLEPAILFFCLSLLADLLHYSYSAINISLFFHSKEKECEGNLEMDVEIKKWRIIPSWIFFIIKLLFVIVGYIILISYLLDRL